MARTSPVHYIAPSAISITPNANNSSNDLAVYVAKGTKIKVRSKGIPQLDFDPSTNTYQEWTMSGRNRRLNSGNGPYTIYVRLRKTDKTKGYLVFAAKTQDGDNWKDKYAYVTMDGLATGTVNSDDNTYWWIKLGDVSASENGERTVTFDTGILGTDQYNEDWVLNPDALPLRVKLSCLIDGEDAGQTPYVPWDKAVVMTASLVEGWSTVAEYLVDHWTIIRNTGNAAADAAWPSAERAATFGSTGAISLAHVRDADDFNEAVATTFTVTAWGTKASDSSSGEDDNSSSSAETMEPLASVTITMFAETLEVYTLETSDAAVTYNPLTDTYSPADGVTMRIRAKAQDGTMTYLTQQQITTAQLHVYYLPVGQDDSGEEPTPELTFSNGEATLPVSAFQAGKNINLWLENGAQVELDRKTVAYVRYGEKGDTPINIYRWYKEGLTPLVPTATNSDEPAPASGDATGATNVYPLNKWSKTSPDQPETGKWMLWMCTSIKHGNGTIDAWTGPVCISGADGDPGADGSDREYIYKRLTTYPFSGTLPANITTGTVDGVATPYDNTIDDWVPDGWSDNALPATASEKYVYEAQRIKQAGNNQTWGAFTGPYLRSNWGVQGMDGDGVQYVYRLFDHELTDAERTSNIPTKPASQNANGEWIPTGWSDDPEAPTLSLPYCYCSIIKRINGTWGSFEKLGLWSKWSEDGADGEDTAMAVCMPAVVSIPTDGNGLAKDDFEQTVTVVIYTNSSDLTSPEIQVTAGGGNVEVSDASMTPYGSGDITFNGETSVFANGEFDGETLVLGDGTSFSTGTLRVTAKKGDTIDEHLCQLMVYGYDTDGTQYRARTSLGIQRNVRGTDGDTPLAVYAWNQDPDTAPAISGNDYPPTGWSKRITTRPGDGWYLWMAESTRHADGTIDAWGVPVRITGEDGNPGADAKDTEWIYRLDTDSGYNGTTGTAGGQTVSGDARYTTDDFVPTNWSDNPLSVSNDHKTEYASFRKYNTSTGRWGDFSSPVVWSHWGERGTDGDGVQYVYKLFDHELTDAERTSNIPTKPAAQNANGEWIPTGWSDDPQAPTSSMPFCYCSVIKQINGTWGSFEKLGLWAKWSEDGADGEDTAMAVCMPAVVSIPTDTSGRVIEDFEKEVAIVVYTNDDDLDYPNIEVTAGGANVEIDSAGMQSRSDNGITFSGETTIVANGEFSGETLVLGDDSVTLSTGSIKVKAKAGDLLTEHVCELMAWSYDDEGTEYRAYTTLTIQRNVRGANGDTPLAVYAWNEDPDTAPAISGNDYPPAGWSTRIISRPGDGWYLWMAESTRHSDGSVDAWGVPVRITGEDGDPGADAKDMEWIYRRDTDSGYNGTTGTAPDTDPDSPTYGQRIAVSGDARYTTDDFVPTDWSDNPLSVSNDHKTEYASYRKYNTSTGRWGNFSEPVVWSHWGERGTDGDGVEYVFIRTNTATAPTIDDSTESGGGNAPYGGKTYKDDDFLPLSSAGRCTDDPASPDSNNRYVWAAKRTKTDPDSSGVRTWTKYSGAMKLWANLSEGALTIDIDNDNDQFGVDSDGKVVTAQSRTTNVTMLYGSQEQAFSSAPTIDLKYEDGTTPAATVAEASIAIVNSKKYLITVNIKATGSNSSVFGSTSHTGLYVDISGTCSWGTKTIRFTLEKVMSGAKGQDPVIYQLNPTKKSFSFTRDASNNLVGPNNSASIRSQINVAKTVGNTTKQLTSAQTGITYSWGFEDESSAASGHSGLAVGTSITVTNSNAASHTYVWVLLSTGDRETLPITKDGATGNRGADGKSIALTLTRNGLYTDAAWNTYGEMGHSEPFAKRDWDPTLTTCRVGDYYIVSGTSSDSGRMHSITYVCTAVTASQITGTSISHLQDGAAGKSIQGHIGRWYEYAGEYGSGLASTLSNTDDHGWYAKRGDYFFMLIADSGVSVATSTIPTSASSTSNWEYMGGDRQYYIAKAFFGEYAQFGSFIINGDWMLSKNGTLNGNPYNGGSYYGTVAAYTYFDPAYPLGTHNLGISASNITGTTQTQRGSSFTLNGRRLVKVTGRVNTSGASMSVALYTTGGSVIGSPLTITSTSETTVLFTFSASSNTSVCIKAWMSSSSSAYLGTITSVIVESFAPNFAVDGLTGKTYQNDAYIKGQIVATSGEFNGTVNASGGNITGTLTVGTYGSGVNSIRIEPSDTTPSIVGYQGTTEVLKLSSQMYYDGTYAASLRLGDSIFRNNGIWICKNGERGRLTTSQMVVEQFENGHHYPVHLQVMDKKIRFGANGASMWPTSGTDVWEGEVYLDGDTLKVKT